MRAHTKVEELLKLPRQDAQHFALEQEFATELQEPLLGWVLL